MQIKHDSNVPLQKFLFQNKDGSLQVVTNINELVRAGNPIDSESGEDLEYMGVVTDDTEVGYYREGPDKSYGSLGDDAEV